MKNVFVLASALMMCSIPAFAQKVDYSVVSVPQESACELSKITSDNDYVCMPEVRRLSSGLSWFSNRIIAASPDGSSLGFISIRNETTNIFIKDLTRNAGSVQRTKRQNVIDFSYSPDGANICFTEMTGKMTQLFQTSAGQGFVCRQITNAAMDYTPVYSPDMKGVFFSRQEPNSISIWNFDFETKFYSSLTEGMNPFMESPEILICTRMNANGRGEIWRINLSTGVEECVVSDNEKSFTTPSLSPDGKYLVMVGTSKIYAGKKAYENTDIYIADADGSNLTQMTYHAADDLSPVWSADGMYIYFISQRGSADATANIWRISMKNFQ